MNINDFVFDKGTRAEVEKVVRDLYANRHRARFFYGDQETGRDWMEEWGTMGTVGKSTGIEPCPLLIATWRSLGGQVLSTRTIVKIVDLTIGAELYRHPAYHMPNVALVRADTPDYTIEARHVYNNGRNNGEAIACFHSKGQADKWLAFMRGQRNSKS